MSEDELDYGEVDAALSEGDLLSDDLGLVESIEGYDNTTSNLVMEGIAARWGVRHIKTESGTARELWDVFLEWLKYIGRLISDMVASALGYGRRALRRQLVLESTFSKLTNNYTGQYTGMVNAADYARRFLINDQFKPYVCEKIMSNLSKDAPDVLGWAAEAVKHSALVLDMVKNKATNLDIRGLGGHNSAFSKYAIGIKTERSLRKVSGPHDTNEEQLLWALPSNAYIQLFRYYFDGKESDTSYPMEGVRFISPNISRAKQNELLSCKEEAIPINRLYEMIRSIKPLALALVNIETSNRKIYREIDKLTRNAEILKKGKNSASVLDRFAYRLAREQLLSANSTLRAVLHTLRTVISGTILRIETHQKAHLSVK